MPGPGDFNVRELIRRLGLADRPELAMQIRETIQPVLNVGDLGGLTPQLNPPAASAGGLIPAPGAGLVNFVVIQCLDAGGGYIENNGAQAGGFAIFDGGPPAALGAITPFAQMVEGPTPPLTLISNATAAAFIDRADSPQERTDGKPLHTIYIGRGQTFVWQGGTNVLSTYNFRWTAVPVTEGGGAGLE